MSKQACILALLAIGPFATAQTKSPAASVYDIHFDQQLRLPAELRLRYTNESRAVEFRCESNSQPVSGSALHLFLAHAPRLSSDRSFLSVSLNYGVLRSLRLDATNQEPAEVIIPLPPHLLHRENRLTFSVSQHYPDGTPPESMWTAILARSYVTIDAEQASTSHDLKQLPLPLLDPDSYRPKAFDVLLPKWISTSTLEATALLVANLVHRVAPETVSINVITTIDQATKPLLLVGTAYEQPEMGSVPTALPESRDEGFVQVVSRGMSPPILFVTGSSPDGVLKAARALTLTGVSGNPARIVSDVPYKPALPRAWKGFIPPTGSFRLADLGIKPLTLGPENDYTLVLPINAPPDFRFFPNGAQMTLQFRMDPGSDGLPRRLLVELNDVPLRDLDADSVSKDAFLALTANVPGHILKSENRLKISLRAQRPTAESLPPAVLLPNSQFTFPCDYGAELPDLALLRFHLYPFSRTPDLSDLVIAVPAALDRPIFEAVVQLAADLGRLAPGEQLAFRLEQAGASQKSNLNESQVINLSLFRKLGQAWPALREVASKQDKRKFALNIEANSTADLKPAIEQFFGEPVLNQLSGDTAFLTTQGLTCLTTGSKTNVYEALLLLHMQTWLRTDWLALPLILITVSGVLFIAWRLMLDRHKSRNTRWQDAD
jgi:hypothetical protein